MSKQKKKKRIKSGDLVTIEVLRNGIRQRMGKRNDYVLTQVNPKLFRVEIL